VTVTWENRGVAPAYEPFQLRLRLCGPTTQVFEIESGNQKWLPLPDKKTYVEQYVLDPPEDLKPGKYTLQLKLYSPAADRDVLLALKADLRDRHGYYTLGKVRIEQSPSAGPRS
jgi:hypothetical protein